MVEAHRSWPALSIGAVLGAAIVATAPAQPCEPHWTGGLGPAQPGTPVNAFASFDSGDGPDLYLGGANGDVWRWDGLSLVLLETVPDTSVFVLAALDLGSGPALYAGGNFDRVAAVPARGVARFDGRTWSALTDGMDGEVWDFAVFDDGSGPALYAAGLFQFAGRVAASNIARWDGIEWSDVAGGTDGRVRALVTFDDGAGPALYAGGTFGMAGDVPAPFIARYDGRSWSVVGDDGLSEPVEDLAVFDPGSGPALVAAGGALGSPRGYVRRLAGAAWVPMGSDFDDWVHTLEVVGRDGGAELFVGGRFHAAGAVDAARVARWDGQGWAPLGAGLSGPVKDLALFDGVHGERLFAGGPFTIVGDQDVERFAAWDGTSWSSLDGGLRQAGFEPQVLDLLVAEEPAGDGKVLYIGGAFERAGPIETRSIARFDGRRWSDVGGEGGNGAVSAMIVFDDGRGPALHAGGSFTFMSGVTAARIGRFDGAAWSPLGSGSNGDVYALAEFDFGSGPALVAGGAFTQAGGVPAARVARWDGSAWSALGSGFADGAVRSLVIFDDGSGPALYAGGTFTLAGAAPVEGVARWDGASWSAVGGGIHSQPPSLGVWVLGVLDLGSGPLLLAGGNFSTAADGTSLERVARLEGDRWIEIGGGIDGYVTALATFDDGTGRALYAGGGTFSGPANPMRRGLVRLDGATWTVVNGGLDTLGADWPSVRDLVIFDEGALEGPVLYAGGRMDSAGGLPSSGLARWASCAQFVLGDLDGDGVVGAKDTVALLDSWGECPGGACPADLDGNRAVDIRDLLILLGRWD